MAQPQREQHQKQRLPAHKPMKPITPRKQPNKDEQGIAMVLALFMGLILLSGLTGLMGRQLASRKFGASKSFQEMAENAAINGFNRILGEANRDSETSYKGYFLSLRNDEESWGWRDPNSPEARKADGSLRKADTSLVELCTDTGFSMTADPLSDAVGDSQAVPLTSGINAIPSMRIDGKDEVELWYRLRGYALAGDGTGNDEGTFQIEGIVARKGSDLTTDYLARTLLTRSLYIDQRVAGAGDWGVLGGYYMNLGNTEIEGKGKILHDVSSAAPFQTSNGCSDSNLLALTRATNDTLAPLIWPVLDRGLPLMSLFKIDEAKDTMENEPSKTRVWNFDDSGSEEFIDRCGNETIACVRREDQDSYSPPKGIDQSTSQIVLKQKDICIGSDSFECHMYIEHINLNKTELLIETGSDSNARPIVLHLELPETNSAQTLYSSGNITLNGTSLLCGVNNGALSCNEKPERLVIGAAAGTDDLSCDEDVHVLNFAGNSLPHAMVLLRQGTVKTSSEATTHGIIWAQNICTGDHKFTLKTSDSSGSVVEAANNLWNWPDKGFPGYGQMVIRGIRGTGLDTFRRW